MCLTSSLSSRLVRRVVVSNRALLLAALAKGTTRLTNLLDSDDVKHMLNALTALGVSYTLSSDRTLCEVTGRPRQSAAASGRIAVPALPRNSDSG